MAEQNVNEETVAAVAEHFYRVGRRAGAGRAMSVGVDDYEGARLNEALGGVMHGGILLLAGPTATGKSDLAAELVVRAQRFWRDWHAGHAGHRAAKRIAVPVYWLTHSSEAPLVRALAAEAEAAKDASLADDAEVFDKIRGGNWSLAEVLKMIASPPGPRAFEGHFLVVDNFDQWALTERDRTDALNALRQSDAILKIIILGKSASSSGAYTLQALGRAADAMVLTETDTFGLKVEKCRWARLPSVSARAELHKLQDFILEEIPWEPKEEGTPVDVAIRLLKETGPSLCDLGRCRSRGSDEATPPREAGGPARGSPCCEPEVSAVARLAAWGVKPGCRRRVGEHQEPRELEQPDPPPPTGRAEPGAYFFLGFGEASSGGVGRMRARSLASRNR